MFASNLVSVQGLKLPTVDLVQGHSASDYELTDAAQRFSGKLALIIPHDSYEQYWNQLSRLKLDERIQLIAVDDCPGWSVRPLNWFTKGPNQGIG